MSQETGREFACKLLRDVAAELSGLGGAAHALWQSELGNQLFDLSERVARAGRLYEQAIGDLQQCVVRDADQASANVVNAALTGCRVVEQVRRHESNDRS